MDWDQRPEPTPLADMLEIMRWMTEPPDPDELRASEEFDQWRLERLEVALGRRHQDALRPMPVRRPAMRPSWKRPWFEGELLRSMFERGSTGRA